MQSSRDELGRWGEKVACRFLRREGYRILGRNYVSPAGEIDVVARDGDMLVFVEVKTRSGTEFGGPLEAVGREKQRRIVRMARWYLAKHRIEEYPCRFDVVAVTRRDDEKNPTIELVRSAFTLP
jgi:putative endonuclease